MGKRTITLLLAVTIILSCSFAFVPIVYAIGSYGVNLASSAYQTTVNPFYAYHGNTTNGAGGECTWYAWGRAYEKLGVSLPCRGNANSWTSEAANAGWSTGTTAKANSIMVEHYSGTGHVMFVEKVENGKAYISEGNWISNGVGVYHEDAINLSTMRRDSWPSHEMGDVDYIYLDSDGPPAGIPQNVCAAQKAANTVGVSWDEAANATSYDVYLVQEPYGWDDIKYSVKVSADYQYAELDGIAPGEYRAFVVARPNANDNQSSWVAVTVEEVGIPQNIVVARRAMDSIGVSWDAVPFATSYDVYMIQSPYAWADIKYSVKVSADYQYAVLDGIAPGEYRVFLIARPNDDYTHQSMWKAVNIKSEYTVTFDPSGGTCSKESKIVVYGQTYGELPTPQKELLTFDGWYTAETGGRKITSSSVVDLLNDQTLYAHWSNPCSEGHSYTYAVTMAPTISAAGDLAGTCSKCGSTTTVTLPKLDTTNYNYAVVTAATCTANGTGRYTWKTTTYGTFTFDVTIPKTSHSYTYAVTTTPTTSATGVLTGTCSRCGNKTTITLPKLNTTDYNYSVTKAATCTVTGTGRYTWKTTTYGTFYFDVTIPKTAHSYTTTVTQPTCTAQGYTTHTCSVCGDSYKDSYTNALGHAWDSGVVTKPATETEPGVKTFTCTRCGETKTEIIPKLDGKPNPFVDVAEGQYYYAPVLWAYYHTPRVTGGTDKTHFSPNQNCTREQIVTFIWKAYGGTAPKMVYNPFQDVKSDQYYYNAVLWAVENGITSGVGGGKFGVSQPCTREQVVTFLWTAAGKPEPTAASNPFRDVKAGQYYYKPVLWAVENGITKGMTADTFGVGKTCTRAQVVTFLYKAVGRGE